MICYLDPITIEESRVISDYWETLEEDSTVFRYTLKQLVDKYKNANVRSVGRLAKGSRFYIPDPALKCGRCSRKMPARNRADFVRRIASKKGEICAECAEQIRMEIIESARQVLSGYQDRLFPSEMHADDLEIEEILSVLSISGNQNSAIGLSPVDSTITGVDSIDEAMLETLISKRVIVNISSIPQDVVWANIIINEARVRHDICDNGDGDMCRHEQIYPGLYTKNSTIPHLYQHLVSRSPTDDEVVRLQDLIKKIQLEKIRGLIAHVGNEYEIQIDNSRALVALLDHLAENYAPINLNYTFRVMAKKATDYMRKNEITGYASRHMFRIFVENYIQYIEENGYELGRIWRLPERISVSPFESVFSQICLRGHFNWNRLSAREVVSIWLNNG